MYVLLLLLVVVVVSLRELSDLRPSVWVQILECDPRSQMKPE